MIECSLPVAFIAYINIVSYYIQRCSSVVREFAHGVMGRRINRSWWPHSAISCSSQCSMNGVTKTVVCVILSVR